MEQNQDMENEKKPGNKNIAQKNDGDEAINDVPLYKKKRIIIPFFIILIAAAAAIYWYIGQLGYISTDDAFIDGNKLSVSSKILGRITNLAVDESDKVKQGQLLVQLDSTDLKAQESQAKAMLALDNESVTLANVNVEKAEDDFNRAQRQYKDNIIPKEQFDHAQRALEAAKASYNIAITKIGTAQAQLKVIKTQLQNTQIYSPMDGVVAKRWVLAGDVVSPGQPIFTIYDLKNIWVTADLEETKLAPIHLGDTVSISVDAFPDQNFSGQVYQIGSNTASQFSLIPPSNASGNFTKVTQRVPIKISIKPVNENGQPDPDGAIKLLPGMSVEINIKVN
ncbi:MAG: HlyD family secretion protein [Ignavibacteriaceae bacterium]